MYYCLIATNTICIQKGEVGSASSMSDDRKQNPANILNENRRRYGTRKASKKEVYCNVNSTFAKQH